MTYIPRIADVVTILAGVALLVLVVFRSNSVINLPDPFTQLEAESVGQRIDAVGRLDFAESQTLIMALQSDCGFCQKSMPFYRRLLERDANEVQIVVAAPPRDSRIGDYLASENVNPDSVVFVQPGTLPVQGTPTLLLVDNEGLVTHAWIGLLNADREAEVIDAMFGGE